MTKTISKERRDEHLADLAEIRCVIDEGNLDPEGKLLPTLANIEREVLHKKYGLVWEEHSEEIDELAEGSVPILQEDRDLFIDEVGETNFLIEGDNLEALKMLQSTHRGRIQLIYIDPPYNTGSNDFKNGDNYVGKDDGFRHSKWLSFMEKRLRLAKTLLSYDGSIFISIDDREQAPLKMLCDEIFGAEYLSIVYVDNAAKQKAFYPDYVIGVREDEEVWVIETKGGWTSAGDSKDIDLYSAKKHAVFREYCKKNGLKGGFVRLDDSSQCLMICDFETEYSKDLNSGSWKLLKDVLG